MAFFDTLDKNTLSVLSALSQMPRAAATPNNAALLADNDNAATNTLKIMAQDRADENKEKRSFLNQLALQKGLYGIKQTYADEEEKKRIEKMKRFAADMKQYSINNNGKQPSTQEMVAMAANAGMSMDDIKALASSKGSSTAGIKPQITTYEENGMKNLGIVGVDEEGKVFKQPIASSPLETDTDRAKRREEAISNAHKKMVETAKLGGWKPPEINPVTGEMEGQSLYDWIEEASLAGTQPGIAAKKYRDEYLSLGGGINDIGKQSSEDALVRYSMSKYGYTPQQARSFADYVKQQTAKQQAETGPTNANAAQQGQGDFNQVRKQIPGAGQQDTSSLPGIGDAVGQLYGEAKNSLGNLYDSTIGKTWRDVSTAWKSAQPEHTSTQAKDTTSQWVDSIKNTDFWQVSGSSSLAPKYVKTLLEKNTDLTRKEKEEIWKQMKSEYGTGKVKDIWEKMDKSIDF